MDQQLCPHCGKTLVLKRRIRVGSWILVLVTYGLWLIVIACYPKKCASCGKSPEGEEFVTGRNSFRGNSLLRICGVVFAVMMVLILSLAIFRPELPANRTKTASIQTCGENLQCYIADTEYLVRIHLSCQSEIEKQANYEYRWTGFTTNSRFPQIRWNNRSENIIELRGGSVEFQNGFGAWRPMVYSCLVDVSSQNIVSVRVEPGRI